MANPQSRPLRPVGGMMQIHWQAGNQSGIRNFASVQDCAKWVDVFLRSFPTASITPNP